MGESARSSLCRAGLHDEGRESSMLSQLSSSKRAEYDLKTIEQADECVNMQL